MGIQAHSPPAPLAIAPGTTERRRFRVSGVVQGVGFRPWVWTLARRHGLGGSVRNTSGAVVIEVEGESVALDDFASELSGDSPRLARIEEIVVSALPPCGDGAFRIESSEPVAGEYQPIAPDAATCGDCLAELLDPHDRRSGYAFINCTACGPRYTIIEDIPYDRPLTTMRAFVMCPPCQSEYDDPANRRFHAQPNACAVCGPRLWFSDVDGVEQNGEPIALAAALLASGGIVALKALGGFQLACGAAGEAGVQRLRNRKHRPTKPLAVMVRDLDAARDLCHVSAAEARLLESSARPIVLLRSRDGNDVAASVAPGQGDLGVLLPVTPLHHLLFAAAPGPLVMTSGNGSEEPIARGNDEAIERLGSIADGFLLHDRDIAARYDDSVVRVVAGRARMIRRARGYAPLPLDVTVDAPPVLALGAHLKNTMTLLRDGRAFVGPHIGDLDHPLTLAHEAEVVATYEHLFRTTPEVVACDLHPDLASTRLAEKRWDEGVEPAQVQHHHAHVASVMAEHGLRGRVIGIAFDGVGWGTDNTIWGGEFLVCDERSFERMATITSVRQPGGDRCAREGWRMARAYLTALGAGEDAMPAWFDNAPQAPDARRWRLVGRLAAGTGAPLTTSAGRLFDAVASLLGVAHVSTYEGEAAMRLEALAMTWSQPVGPLPVRLSDESLMRINTVGLVAALVELRLQGHAPAEIAAIFHESLAVAIVSTCSAIAVRTGLQRVALSGGVFQNALLLERTLHLLAEGELTAYANEAVPANDGGVSLGQALVASSRNERAMRS